MADTDLEEIRARRMAEMQAQMGGVITIFIVFIIIKIVIFDINIF